MGLIDEILEQPAAVQRLLDSAPTAFAPISAALRARRPRFAVIAARGTSDNAGIYAQYLLAIRNRLVVALAAPSTITLYGARPNLAESLVVGTFSAHLQQAQAALAAAVLACGKPTVTVALRTPWDLLAYPSARTHLCSYGILPPSMEALAAALFGEAPFAGRLPVDIAGLHPRGHGLMAWG